MFERLGVEAFFTTRDGGVSSGEFASLNLGSNGPDDPDHVRENFRRVATAIGSESVRRVRQIHSAAVVHIDALDESAEGDAIITNRVGEAVALIVADCAPLLLVDPAGHQLAVVHAGWRGLAAGVIEATVNALDADVSQLHVAIGPAISGDRYQVGPEVIAASPYFAPHARADVGDRFMLDTRGAALSILEALSVPRENVSISTQVTDGGARFFSDRAARPCGRFALVAKWQS
ncbi:MAG: hypothetical protein F2790_03525 [Actinobacteria bacterium]|nr:hypothetical protein [Actinomycetota bacterium]